jgi:hypothetical protein
MIQAIAMVLDFAPEHWSSGTRMVAIALADYVNTETRSAWPSIANLARRTGLSERMVQRHLRQIELDGWIEMGNPSITKSTMWIWKRRLTLEQPGGDTYVTRWVTPTSPPHRGAGVTPTSPKPLVLNHHVNR